MGTLDNLNRERGQSKQRRRKRGAQPFSPEGAETRFGTDAACKGGTMGAPDRAMSVSRRFQDSTDSGCSAGQSTRKIRSGCDERTTTCVPTRTIARRSLETPGRASATIARIASGSRVDLCTCDPAPSSDPLIPAATPPSPPASPDAVPTADPTTP